MLSPSLSLTFSSITFRCFARASAALNVLYGADLASVLRCWARETAIFGASRTRGATHLSSVRLDGSHVCVWGASGH